MPLGDYFTDVYYRVEALKPLIVTEVAGSYDLECYVTGGGLHGQSECLAYAVTKALIKINPAFTEDLYYFGLVGVDARRVEPKRMNLYSARKRPPYVRR